MKETFTGVSTKTIVAAEQLELINFRVNSADSVLSTLNAKIAVDKINKKGSRESIHKNTPLLSLARFSTYEQGVIFQQLVTGVYKCRFPVMLAVGGGVKLEDNESLEITLSGLDSADTYELEATNLGTHSDVVLLSNQIGVEAPLVEKTFSDIANTVAFVVPNSAKFQKIEVDLRNGTRTTLTREMLIDTNLHRNFDVASDQGVIVTPVTDTEIMIWLDQAVKASIYSDGTGLVITQIAMQTFLG